MKALIIGHTGQDGTYLSSILQDKGYEVVGISKNLVSETQGGISGINNINDINISHPYDVFDIVNKIKPDEIYYLAAVHQSSSDIKMEDGELFQKSFDVNVKILVNFLEAARKIVPQAKIFYAASSHIFGNPEKAPQDESTPFNPDCIYGITKMAGMRVCRFYRENHKIFVSVGIMYNHESPYRESKYLSKKIVETAAAIKQGKKNELILGNIDAKVDWGYASDYMQAVHAIMQLPNPDDFIISSGKRHTVKEFVQNVFEEFGINDWKKYIKIDPYLITKKQKSNLFGNNRKIKDFTGWFPSVNFNELIKILVASEKEQWKKQSAI